MADPTLRSIGPKLRAMRLERAVTLEALAEATRISASTLSRLETGSRQPNLELLMPVIRHLRIGIGELIPDVVPDPRVEQKPVHDGDHSVTVLSPPSAPVQTLKVTLAPTPDQRIEVRTHDGYEWLYVLRGRLRLIVGDHDLTLAAGEAAEFDTRTPHWLGPAGNRSVELLSIFSKNGQRMHTHAPAEA